MNPGPDMVLFVGALGGILFPFAMPFLCFANDP